jgi:hypothetical protein
MPAPVGSVAVMSGWLRLGVVLSVLWVIGFPIYYHIDDNNTRWKQYQTCLDIYIDRFPTPRMIESHCAPLIKQSDTILQKEFFMFGVAAPLVLFWILGATIFVVVRWIRRGFAVKR